MRNFIRKPSIDLYPGVIVRKDTVLEYKSETVEQKVENLLLHTISTVKGEGYESKTETTIYLEEGDILLYEDGERGYIKPVAGFVTVEEAIADLTYIKDLG